MKTHGLRTILCVLLCALCFGEFIPAQTSNVGHISPARQKVIDIVAQIQRADYEGDRAALKRLYEELAPFADDQDLASRVRDWRGFALWRRALNGFNESADPKELEHDLKQAVDEFDAAVSKDPGFVDAKVGAVSCLSNLLFLNQSNPARVQELVAQGVPRSKEAQAAAPENPRLLWVLGANRWVAPAERGGGQDKAMETYQKGLEAARKQKGSVADPLEPSWGEPELLTNLAWANLHRTTPDLNAAEQYARSALELVPYWHYVRDILIPQINAANAAKAKQVSDAPPAQHDTGAEAFAKLRSLVGEWAGSFEWTGGRSATGTVNATYYATGNGSAIVENLSMGGVPSMTSVYHLDGSDLRMTHYCAAQNQPRLKASRIDIAQGILDFSFVDATNLPSSDAPHVDGLEMRWLDADHISLTFLFAAGSQRSKEHIDLKRVHEGPAVNGK